MDSAEKQAFADEAEKALDHELVQKVMLEFADNMGFAFEGLPKIGLLKIAMYVATVARAQALGIDPDELRHTPQEGFDAQMRIAEAFTRAGKPVTIVVPGEPERTPEA